MKFTDAKKKKVPQINFFLKKSLLSIVKGIVEKSSKSIPPNTS